MLPPPRYVLSKLLSVVDIISSTMMGLIVPPWDSFFVDFEEPAHTAIPPGRAASRDEPRRAAEEPRREVVEERIAPSTIAALELAPRAHHYPFNSHFWLHYFPQPNFTIIVTTTVLFSLTQKLRKLRFTFAEKCTSHVPKTRQPRDPIVTRFLCFYITSENIYCAQSFERNLDQWGSSTPCLSPRAQEQTKGRVHPRMTMNCTRRHGAPLGLTSRYPPEGSMRPGKS